MIGVPTVPQSVAVNRIAVSAGGTAIAYVKDAQWVEPPARLFQRLLSETVQAKTGMVALDLRQFPVTAGTQIQGQIRSFGVSVAFAGATTGEAVVIYDAALSRDKGQKVATQRFEARVPVSAIEGPIVGNALNLAANRVAGEVADWVATR
jgi:cholesterol transport system auxiliary component